MNTVHWQSRSDYIYASLHSVFRAPPVFGQGSALSVVFFFSFIFTPLLLILNASACRCALRMLLWHAFFDYLDRTRAAYCVIAQMDQLIKTTDFAVRGLVFLISYSIVDACM